MINSNIKTNLQKKKKKKKATKLIKQTKTARMFSGVNMNQLILIHQTNQNSKSNIEPTDTDWSNQSKFKVFISRVFFVNIYFYLHPCISQQISIS